LLGYTGAIFQKFFGTSQGMLFSLLILLMWWIVPSWLIYKISKKKDF